jgi:hypothetical protein
MPSLPQTPQQLAAELTKKWLKNRPLTDFQRL